jgi:hypothetical protein
VTHLSGHTVTPPGPGARPAGRGAPRLRLGPLANGSAWTISIQCTYMFPYQFYSAMCRFFLNIFKHFQFFLSYPLKREESHNSRDSDARLSDSELSATVTSCGLSFLPSHHAQHDARDAEETLRRDSCPRHSMPPLWILSGSRRKSFTSTAARSLSE